MLYLYRGGTATVCVGQGRVGAEMRRIREYRDKRFAAYRRAKEEGNNFNPTRPAWCGEQGTDGYYDHLYDRLRRDYAGQGTIEKHHIIPQKFRKQCRDAGLDGKDGRPELDDYTVPVGKYTHRNGIHGYNKGQFTIDGTLLPSDKYNNDWQIFFDNRPNPHAADIMQFACEMAVKYRLMDDNTNISVYSDAGRIADQSVSSEMKLEASIDDVRGYNDKALKSNVTGTEVSEVTTLFEPDGRVRRTTS